MPLIVTRDGALVFNGGKHDGRTVESVARSDPKYLRFVRNRGPSESLSDEVFHALDEIMIAYHISLKRR